uniref:ATP synthase F0 subunit 8 n=1 Tax=Micrurus fulvius TaxID=8637 RepID=D0V5C9_MICFL|nr:ATP synthase F0 subunit 8 [Micrurus fulvius]ACY09612.1 ATP synthase F0 subunit 8 [Micrurus fulvius]
MPQLSTTYILLIYLWTWLTMHLIMQKTKSVSINKTPMTSSHAKLKKLTPTLPWT